MLSNMKSLFIEEIDFLFALNALQVGRLTLTCISQHSLSTDEDCLVFKFQTGILEALC